MYAKGQSLGAMCALALLLGTISSLPLVSAASTTQTSGLVGNNSPCSSTLCPPPQSPNCQQVISGTYGWFSSPNFPSSYPNNVTCSWLIDSPRPITLFLGYVNLEPSRDYVRVYNGPTTASPQILTTSAYTALSSPLRPSSKKVLVTLTSDNNGIANQGFFAMFYLQVQTSGTCGI